MSSSIFFFKENNFSTLFQNNSYKSWINEGNEDNHHTDIFFSTSQLEIDNNFPEHSSRLFFLLKKTVLEYNFLYNTFYYLCAKGGINSLSCVSMLYLYIEEKRFGICKMLTFPSKVKSILMSEKLKTHQIQENENIFSFSKIRMLWWHTYVCVAQCVYYYIIRIF